MLVVQTVTKKNNNYVHYYMKSVPGKRCKIPLLPNQSLEGTVLYECSRIAN